MKKYIFTLLAGLFAVSTAPAAIIKQQFNWTGDAGFSVVMNFSYDDLFPIVSSDAQQWGEGIGIQDVDFSFYLPDGSLYFYDKYAATFIFDTRTEDFWRDDDAEPTFWLLEGQSFDDQPDYLFSASYMGYEPGTFQGRLELKNHLVDPMYIASDSGSHYTFTRITPVPDGGSTALFLAGSLLGMAGLRKALSRQR